MAETGKNGWLDIFGKLVTPLAFAYLVWQMQVVAIDVKQTRELVLIHIAADSSSKRLYDEKLKNMKEILDQEIQNRMDDKKEQNEKNKDFIHKQAVLPERQRLTKYYEDDNSNA